MDYNTARYWIVIQWYVNFLPGWQVTSHIYKPLNTGWELIDPVRLTTWSIMSAPLDIHRIHFHVLYSEVDSGFHPLLVATTRLKANIEVKGMEIMKNRLAATNKDW